MKWMKSAAETDLLALLGTMRGEGLIEVRSAAAESLTARLCPAGGFKKALRGSQAIAAFEGDERNHDGTVAKILAAERF